MGWVPWLASWWPVKCPLNRKQREFIITILVENPLEFRVAFLRHQIRSLFVKTI